MKLYVKAKKEISNISSILDKQIGLSDKQLLEIERDEVYMKRLLISQTNTELARLDELMKAENDVLDAILDYNKQKKQFEIDIKKQKEKIIKSHYYCFDILFLCSCRSGVFFTYQRSGT